MANGKPRFTGKWMSDGNLQETKNNKEKLNHRQQSKQQVNESGRFGRCIAVRWVEVAAMPPLVSISITAHATVDFRLVYIWIYVIKGHIHTHTYIFRRHMPNFVCKRVCECVRLKRPCRRSTEVTLVMCYTHTDRHTYIYWMLAVFCLPLCN